MKLLAMDELKSAKGIPYSRAHLWRLIKSGQFVAPIKLGANRVAFIEAEIDAWIEARTTERDERAA